MIEIRDLTKSFAKVQAVRSVSFAARDGAVTALLGPNGAGKSTTLRILSTVINADGGEARVDGFEVKSDPLQVRRRLGVLPHNAGIYGRLTAEENIRYYGRLQGLDRETLDARVAHLVEQLDMGDIRNRRTAGFSQGQTIKVALARALVHNPGNVVLDEPTNGLDVMATRSLREIILGLRAEGRCVLFSSHVMQEVAALADQVVVIGHGEVRFSGTLDDLRGATGETDLENAFVAAVGEAHEGTVQERTSATGEPSP